MPTSSKLTPCELSSNYAVLGFRNITHWSPTSRSPTSCSRTPTLRYAKPLSCIRSINGSVELGTDGLAKSTRNQTPPKFHEYHHDHPPPLIKCCATSTATISMIWLCWTDDLANQQPANPTKTSRIQSNTILIIVCRSSATLPLSKPPKISSMLLCLVDWDGRLNELLQFGVSPCCRKRHGI